jgi:hypothetical protein
VVYVGDNGDVADVLSQGAFCASFGRTGGPADWRTGGSADRPKTGLRAAYIDRVGVRGKGGERRTEGMRTED